jgi:hypothetical protein
MGWVTLFEEIISRRKSNYVHYYYYYYYYYFIIIIIIIIIINHIVTYWLVTRQIISGFWILYLDLFDIHQAGFTITYSPQSYCKHTALILHRLTSCILLPLLFTLN